MGLRDQEAFCRERAQQDTARRAFWSAEAEVWQRAVHEEIAAAFRSGLWHGAKREAVT